MEPQEVGATSGSGDAGGLDQFGVPGGRTGRWSAVLTRTAWDDAQVIGPKVLETRIGGTAVGGRCGVHGDGLFSGAASAGGEQADQDEHRTDSNHGITTARAGPTVGLSPWKAAQPITEMTGRTRVIVGESIELILATELHAPC